MNDQTRLIRHGIKWVVGSMVLQRVVRFATTAILARFFLEPEEYGLMWVALSVLMVLEALRNLGFTAAFIQRTYKDDEEEVLAADTALCVALAISTPVFLVCYFAAPWITSFMPKMEGLLPVFRVMLLAFLLEPFLMIPGMIVKKRLELAKHASSEILAMIVNSAVALSLAVLGYGVWSLVFAHMVSRLTQTLYLARAVRWRPRARFDKRIAGELFGFGKWLWGGTIIGSVGRELDRLVLGRLYGSIAVGAYGLGSNLANQSSVYVATLVNRIAFPVWSRSQSDQAALRFGIVKALSHIAIVCFPLSLGLGAVSEHFVHAVYGERWSDTVPILQVLVIFGLLHAVSSVNGPMLSAIGKPYILFWTSTFHQTLTISMFWLLRHKGPVGIAWAVTLPMFLVVAVMFLLVVRNIKVPLTALLEPILRSGAAALVMVLAVEGFQRAAPELSPVPALFIEVPIGVLVYCGVTAIVNRVGMHAFIGTVREVVASRAV